MYAGCHITRKAVAVVTGFSLIVILQGKLVLMLLLLVFSGCHIVGKVFCCCFLSAHFSGCPACSIFIDIQSFLLLLPPMSSSFPHARRDVTFVVAVNFSSCPTPEDLVAVFKQYLL